MKFEDYMGYNCNLYELSEHAKGKGIVQSYFGNLKGSYRKFFDNIPNREKAKYAIRIYRAQKEILCSSQMLMESEQSMKNGCIIGYYFLSYYALFHAMQANLFLDINLENGEIIQLSHSKTEKYFTDFYCKGNKSILPHKIIDIFVQLKEFREIYSYAMPFNNPSKVDIDINELSYFLRLCFQLCNLKTLVINQVQSSVKFEVGDMQGIQDYFRECCYRRNPKTNEIIKDEADEVFFDEMISIAGVDNMPFSISIEHIFDEYGGYDSTILNKMGFKNVDRVRAKAYGFCYKAIM